MCARAFVCLPASERGEENTGVQTRVFQVRMDRYIALIKAKHACRDLSRGLEERRLSDRLDQVWPLGHR
jgi:hypothetical protein